VVQAVIFSVAHVGFAPITDIAFFINAFLMGMVLGLLKSYSKTLIAPTVAHGLIWTMMGLV
jgi:membrane protease YdiL (CAAX protease family)